MIIDVRTHVWASLDQLGPEVAERLRATRTERWGQLDGGFAAHEQATSCVDASFVLGFRSDRTGARIPNELVAQAATTRRGTALGVAGIDPMSEDANDQLDAAIGLGLIGVTVAPVLQGFHPTHSSAMRLYERCTELSMPVFVVVPHPMTATAEMEFGRPTHWDEVARSFPDLRIVISQLGHPWVDETLVLIGKHENVYAEISGIVSRPWELYNVLLSSTSLDVMHKLLFASGFPFDTPAKAIETLYSLNAFAQGSQLPSVPRASIRSIIERDTLTCLGIDDALSPRTVPVDDTPATDRALTGEQQDTQDA